MQGEEKEITLLPANTIATSTDGISWTLDEKEVPTCRVCYLSEGVLFSPCLCDGSVRFIHQGIYHNKYKNTLYYPPRSPHPLPDITPHL